MHRFKILIDFHPHSQLLVKCWRILTKLDSVVSSIGANLGLIVQMCLRVLVFPVSQHPPQTDALVAIKTVECW